MAETVDQVTSSLRNLAVELVRGGRTSEAAAVLSGIGAVEMLSMFAQADKPSDRPAEENHHQEQHSEPFG